MATYPSALVSFTSKTDNVVDVLAAHVNLLQDEVVAIETEVGTLVKGSSSDLAARLARTLSDAGNLDFALATTLTISSGSVTPTQNFHLLDTEGTTDTDDLDTIVASSTDIRARVLFVRAAHTDRTIVIKHNTGNIVTTTGADLTLEETYRAALMVYDSGLSKWICFASGLSAASSSDATAGTSTSLAITPALLASGTVTLTNKRITKRVVATTQAAAPAINTDDGDVFNITGLAQAITSLTTNLTGTPTDGQMFLLNVTDDGTGRAITPGASFAGTLNNSIAALTTVANKTLSLYWKWSAALSKYELVHTDQSL